MGKSRPVRLANIILSAPAASRNVASTGHLPGRWARSLAADSLYFLDAGLVLLLLGALAGREPASEVVSSQDTRC